MLLEVLLGESGETAIIADAVLMHLSAHRQIHRNQTEAGGQLFATVLNKTVLIREATGPRSTDRRSRSSYVPDRKAEQHEIDDRFARGLNFIGDWHTHPEPFPTASDVDIRNMRECFRKSQRALSGFLLVIVGTAPFPQGLHVSLHNGRDVLHLRPRLSELKTRSRSMKKITGVVRL